MRQDKFDWDRLKKIPIRDLIGRYWPEVARPDRGVPCPLCREGKKHAKWNRKGNTLVCWANSTKANSMDSVALVAAVEGISPGEAAERLSREYGIPIGDEERLPKAPPPDGAYLGRWRAAASDGWPRECDAWFQDRGFPPQWAQQLHSKSFVRYIERRHVLFEGNTEPDQVPVLTFPVWRCLEAADLDYLGDVDHPSALWHRLLSPIRKGDKVDKDRNDGSTAGCIYTTRPHAAFQAASEIIIAEGIVKGLAIEAALTAADCAYDELQANDERTLREAKQRTRVALSANGGRVWFALLGVGAVVRVPDILDVLLIGRRSRVRPRIRVALDNDSHGVTAAENLFRELVSRGWDVSLSYPQEPAKDWDEALKRQGGEGLRKEISKEDGNIVLRPEARRMATNEFFVEGSALYAMVRERKQDAAGEDYWTDRRELVADFAPRMVRRFRLYDFAGQQPRAEAYEVRCRRRNSRGLQTFYLSEADYNEPGQWRHVGAVHKPQLFRLFASEGKEMSSKENSIVHAIGLVPNPDEPGKWSLVSGPQFRQLNGAYRSSFDPVYAGADWDGEWGGARDERQAIADGRRVVEALRAMFSRPLGSLVLYWAVGCLLKPIARAWPHLEIIAQRGTGKSTLTVTLSKLLRMQVAQLDALSTDYRTLGLFGNHVFPVAVDEVSRLNPLRRPRVLSYLNEAYDAGTKTILYGSDQYPVTLLASTLMLGQDSILDEALTSKTIACRLEASDKAGGTLPMLAELPSWPWRQWGRHLCEVLRESFWRQHYEKAAALIEPHVPSELTSRDRFVHCWAAVMAARRIVLDWLGLGEQPEELRGMLGLLGVQAESSAEAGLESLAILQAYAAIVNQQPQAHPVTVRTPVVPEHPELDRDGVWIVPETVLATVRDAGLHFAVVTSRAFVSALKAEGLLGTPPPADDDVCRDDWEGGYWYENGKGWQPSRKKVKHRVHGRATYTQSYLIPWKVAERYGLNFPTEIGDDEE